MWLVITLGHYIPNVWAKCTPREQQPVMSGFFEATRRRKGMDEEAIPNAPLAGTRWRAAVRPQEGKTHDRRYRVHTIVDRGPGGLDSCRKSRHMGMGLFCRGGKDANPSSAFRNIAMYIHRCWIGLAHPETVRSLTMK
jgi:hypothetical protein